MTSKQKTLFNKLSGSITKEQSIDFGFEFALDLNFTKEVLALLKNEKEIFNFIWILRSLTDKELNRIRGIFDFVFSALKKNAKNDGILRNGVALLTFIKIPSAKLTEVYDLCFSFLRDKKRAIAVKVFSIEVCYNIAEPFPELLEELALQIEENLMVQGDISPGIYSRGNRYLKKINQRLHK
ncbi:hypothetical protein EGI22_07375 [Lacihabitans sp. LS3-19]|uniref:hypothetical protein n=1 Tax=Lacihabitans sp. LS3-19 TaxID=2487335 RepID=UPI0020CD32D6|nr:hypothetical protein [Lacihabitans sp. LS3-19]MCP9767729.1 hypothetical protein [Lacihabitans sp. LS3-19]